MNARIFHAILFVTILVLSAGSALVLVLAHNIMMSNNENLLKIYTDSMAADINANSSAELFTKQHFDAFRVTLINASGGIYFDSAVSRRHFGDMDNHGNREEVRVAEAFGSAFYERRSSTLDQRTIYYAVRLENGDILRCSMTTDTVFSLTKRLAMYMLGILIFAAFVSAVIARRLSKRIVHPINALDLDHPLDNEIYDELNPLLERIYEQQSRIEEQFSRISRHNRAMHVITESMTEGLMVLDHEGRIISINEQARNIYDIADNCIGRSFLTVDRSEKVKELFEEFDLKNEVMKKVLEFDRKEHHYRIYFNRIAMHDSIMGYAIFFIDMTDSLKAEKQRQEFTANVSHELKTPLQAIAGYAELMENNMVPSQDIVMFSHKIRNDCRALLRMINDIIYLSRLDEGSSAMAQKLREDVELTEVVDDIFEVVASKADAKKVSLERFGGPIDCFCIYRNMYELLFNLCDNAVKYNREGGFVKVYLEQHDGNIYIRVADNGIGIPEEDLKHIFERFYRVDKSRTNRTEGTGLGLAIVNRIAKYYHGSVGVKSKLGEGTEFFAVIPEKELQPQPKSEVETQTVTEDA